MILIPILRSLSIGNFNHEMILLFIFYFNYLHKNLQIILKSPLALQTLSQMPICTPNFWGGLGKVVVQMHCLDGRPLVQIP